MTPQKIVRKVKNKESNSIQASLKKMIIIIPVFNEAPIFKFYWELFLKKSLMPIYFL